MPHVLGPRDRTDLALIRRCKAPGGTVHHDRLARRMAPFVAHLVRPYLDLGEPREDLLQVGSLALMQAVDRFDVDLGYAFCAYAAPTVTGALKRHFRDTAWRVHVPRGLQELHARRRRCTREMELELGRSVTTPEVAGRLGVSVRRLEECDGLGSAMLPVSLDAADDASHLLPARVDGGFALVEDVDAMRHGVGALQERDREILWMTHAEDLTQAQIGARLGISQVQVSRLLRDATRRAREVALAPA